MHAFQSEAKSIMMCSQVRHSIQMRKTVLIVPTILCVLYICPYGDTLAAVNLTVFVLQYVRPDK